MVEGTDGQLFGMEVDVEAAKAELREIASRDQGKGATDFLKNVGLGAFADQLQDLKLGQLLSFLHMTRLLSSLTSSQVYIVKTVSCIGILLSPSLQDRLSCKQIDEALPSVSTSHSIANV